jgi:hypothetical protein
MYQSGKLAFGRDAECPRLLRSPCCVTGTLGGKLPSIRALVTEGGDDDWFWLSYSEIYITVVQSLLRLIYKKKGMGGIVRRYHWRTEDQRHRTKAILTCNPPPLCCGLQTR